MSDAGAARAYTPAAREALTAFGIASTAIELVTVSENVTFKVTCNDGREFVLRLHRPGYHTLEELNSERLWIRALANAGIAVPAPVPTLDGREYTQVSIQATGESRYAGLSFWTEGELLADALHHNKDVSTFEHYFEQLGALAAKMHDQAARWRVPVGFTRHSLDVDGLLGDAPFWGPFWEHPALLAHEKKLVIETRDRLRGALTQLGRNAAHYSVIHADLHPGNLLVHGNELTVIDFDDAGFGWHAYDIAVALIRYREAAGFPAIQRSFVGAYRSVRTLPDEVLAWVPTFMLIRDMAILGWIHQRPELGRTDADTIKFRLCEQCERFQMPD